MGFFLLSLKGNLAPFSKSVNHLLQEEMSPFYTEGDRDRPAKKTLDNSSFPKQDRNIAPY